MCCFHFNQHHKYINPFTKEFFPLGICETFKHSFIKYGIYLNKFCKIITKVSASCVSARHSIFFFFVGGFGGGGLGLFTMKSYTNTPVSFSSKCNPSNAQQIFRKILYWKGLLKSAKYISVLEKTLQQ